MIRSQPLDLNILPEHYRPRRIAAPVAAGVVLAVVLLLGLIPTYGVLAGQKARTATAADHLAEAKAALEQTSVDQATLEEVEQQIAQTRAYISRLQTETGAFGDPGSARSNGIAAAVSALVPRIHITTVVQEGSSFTLTGEAGSQALVLDYARALQMSGQFMNVRILSIVNVDPLGLAPEVEFSIAMEQ